MGRKTPKAKRRSRHAKRDPKTTPTVVSGQQETPLFCFHYADRRTGGTYAFSYTDPHATVILDFICEMSKLTWAEIGAQSTGTRNGHRKHHPMPITVLDDAPQRDLQRAQLDETFGDEMFRFRLGSKRRLWGFRRGRTFHVVWWDDQHEVYPTDPD